MFVLLGPNTNKKKPSRRVRSPKPGGVYVRTAIDQRGMGDDEVGFGFGGEDEDFGGDDFG